jgi:hypothetical protein
MIPWFYLGERVAIMLSTGQRVYAVLNDAPDDGFYRVNLPDGQMHLNPAHVVWITLCSAEEESDGNDD